MAFLDSDDFSNEDFLIIQDALRVMHNNIVCDLDPHDKRVAHIRELYTRFHGKVDLLEEIDGE